MSAYIVDKNHVLYLLGAADSRSCRGNYGPLTWYHNDEHHKLPSDDEALAEVGNMLWMENVKSVSARYPNESSGTLPGPKGGGFVITPNDVNRILWDRFDPVQVIKACDCFNYQSCEHEGWKTSEAFAFIESLRHSAWGHLPGYESAEWGAPEPMKRNVVSLASLMK